MKKHSLLLNTKTKVEIGLDELPPEIQKILQEIADKKAGVEKRADDEEVQEEVQVMHMPMMMASEDRELEERGIIILDREISKQTLARASAKLLAFQFNEKWNEPIQLILNSPGGYLDAAWAFIDIMDSIRLPIRTIAMGEIVSAAAMIFVAGDERVMSPNSSAMIHHFSTMTGGSYPELVASRKSEDLQAKRIVQHFLKHSTKYKNAKEVEDKILLSHDNWLSPQEMQKHGLCDVVLASKKKKPKKRK
jgi:ATP-dependent Clp protease protease subunit